MRPLGNCRIQIQFRRMRLAFRLVVLAVVVFGLGGATIGGSWPGGVSGSELAAKLQSALISAGQHATTQGELRLPLGTGSSAPRERSHSPADRTNAHVCSASLAHQSHHGLSDRRAAIRLTCRGVQVPHSSDEPPERPPSLS